MLKQQPHCHSIFKHGEPTVEQFTTIWIGLINTVEQNKSITPSAIL